ncbi:MAG: DEAD/DEAH box helicase [Saccharofermentanales bacterium]
MTDSSPEQNRNLIAVCLPDGVMLDFEMTDSKTVYSNGLLFEQFRLDWSKALFNFGFEDRSSMMTPSIAFIHDISHRFIKALARNPYIEFTRSASSIDSEEQNEILQSVPYLIGLEFVDEAWIGNIWNRLSEVFTLLNKDAPGTIAEFLQSRSTRLNMAGRVFFHLVENPGTDFPFAFMATYSTQNGQEKKVSHVPLKHALLEFREQNDLLLQLLSTVSKAADKSGLISELVESGELFSPIKFTADEAYTFLKEIPMYEECGVLCRIPHWWKKRSSSIRLMVSVGNKEPSLVGMDALMSFDPKLSLDGQDISKEEIEALLLQTAGLSLIKGKWVEVDHDRLQAALDAFEKANRMADGDSLTLADAMRLQLKGAGYFGLDDKAIDIQVTNGEWLSSIRSKLMNPEEISNVSPGRNFKCTLRHYQQSGLDWLVMMRSLGFGALLADDMGLGKTVQILALLEFARNKGKIRTLLVIPASLIGNWENEIARFTPNLKYCVLHTGNTVIDFNAYDLFITTYGMTARIDELKGYRWDLLIIDEAQAIKNPGAKQTKAVKQLQSRSRIAMTGTPIENRLSELWSIFDFLNAGLLGNAKEFKDLVKGMQDSEDYSKIRNVISPFILRRLKTDKNVISDLPDKIELKEYAGLSKKQVVLYMTLVDEIAGKLESTEGIERKGLVLASIMKFKQICNHPDQYLGGLSFEASHSGKFELLAEICETIREKHERVLIFTQFREMTEPLAQYLEEVFGRKGLVLHGGTPVKKRAELVAQMNGREYVPFMVLSLKAGGVGLNLTGASHVIHFDRWWNPAVENQATDRAFRIGQKQNVMVHKFISTGTIEEKIDRMIEGKQKLASDIIGSSGEQWITEMNNAELMNLFSLA